MTAKLYKHVKHTSEEGEGPSTTTFHPGMVKLSKYRGGSQDSDTSRKRGLILKNNARSLGDELETGGGRGLNC